MSKTFCAILGMILLSPTFLKDEIRLRKFWIVWNVGQGQWSTYIDEDTCHHFDMGGEKNPLPRVARLCRSKMNRISLSHWDLDHISFTRNSGRVLKNACIETPPLGTASTRKKLLLAGLPSCTPEDHQHARELSDFSRVSLPQKANDLSHVFLVARKFLIPGDSTVRQESIWSQHGEISSTRFLLLGHHGSRTSTSEELLSHLPHLQTAVASARFAKYGHPHLEIVQRLKKHHIPLLKTEDWGHLWFEEY
jgi:competence protein ComEC